MYVELKIKTRRFEIVLSVWLNMFLDFLLRLTNWNAKIQINMGLNVRFYQDILISKLLKWRTILIYYRAVVWGFIELKENKKPFYGTNHEYKANNMPYHGFDVEKNNNLK